MDVDWFRHTPSWKVEQLNSLAEAGATFLFLEGSDPSALKGIDPAKPAAASKARNTECKSFRDGMDFGRNVWCIAGVPVAAWAREVFPGTSDAEAIYRLWNLILSVARADGDDPESAWETHNASFEKTKRFLNGHRFDALRYEASNGTNLIVGMNPGHVWDGGAAARRTAPRSSPTSRPRRSSPRRTAPARRALCTPPCRWSTPVRSCATSGCALRPAAWWTSVPSRAPRCCVTHRDRR